MTPDDYINAARCPPTVPLGEFGLWKIEREPPSLKNRQPYFRMLLGFDDHVVLSRWTSATMHLERGDIVMEDSCQELRKHLPIWLNASGRVLITGLGLGCVVRGLLANPAVEHITVIEIDDKIIELIWPEFIRDERLLLLQGDALTMEFPPGLRWDYAWHDIWSAEVHHAVLHGDLMIRYRDRCGRQGAWGLPRWFKRKMGGDMVAL